MMARERSPEELAEDLAEVRHQVSRLGDRFDAAPYVRADLHHEQIDRLRADVASVRVELAGVRQMTMWTLGILLSAIVGAIIVLVVSVARGG